MDLFDNKEDKARDLKDKAQGKADSTDMDDKAREEFDRMRRQRENSDEPSTDTTPL